MTDKKDPEEKATPEPKKVKARVLVDCAFGKPNDVAEVEDGQVRQAEAEGLIDTEKSAVSFAQALDRQAKKK